MQQKEKTVEGLCEEMGIANVEVSYRMDDFENWTIQRLFDQYMRPKLEEKNPHATTDDIQKVLDVKWKEFALLNPYIPKTEDGETISDYHRSTSFSICPQKTTKTAKKHWKTLNPTASRRCSPQRSVRSLAAAANLAGEAEAGGDARM